MEMLQLKNYIQINISKGNMRKLIKLNNKNNNF